MTRLPTLLLVLPAVAALGAPAGAVEMPLRKPGLWELKMDAGARLPAITMQHCTDESIDKKMSTAFSPMSKEVCTRNEIQKTATGYSIDADCTVGGIAVTSHSDITGDFDSAYTVKLTSHQAGAPAMVPHDTAMTLHAKWLGACRPEQKPGDIVMPGGFRMNIRDIEKMKALLPK